jgi:hypothetical protein
VLKRDNKLVTDRVNLLTFALRPMLPASRAAMESGKLTKDEVLKAAMDLGQPEAEALAMFDQLDLDGDGTLDYSEFAAAFRDDGKDGGSTSHKGKRMAMLAEMAAHPQWHLLLDVAGKKEGRTQRKTHTRWFRELQALVAKADPASDRPVEGSSGKKFTYAADPGLLVWDLCCCVAAWRQRDSYVAICQGSHLNPDNTHAVVAQFLDVAQAQAAAWSRAEAHRFAAAASAHGRRRCSGSREASLPLVLGLQEWPGAGSAREAVYRSACVERGLHVVAPGDDVALAWTANVLPADASAAGVARGRLDGDGHGVGWAALDLTSEGGWAGAAEAGTQAPTPDLTGAHNLHRKTSLR